MFYFHYLPKLYIDFKECIRLLMTFLYILTTVNMWLYFGHYIVSVGTLINISSKSVCLDCYMYVIVTSTSMHFVFKCQFKESHLDQWQGGWGGGGQYTSVLFISIKKKILCEF